MRVRSLILLVACAASLLSAAAVRADQLDDIRKKGEVVVGALGTDEPNSFIDPASRKIVGYDIDIAEAVARSLGVKLVVKQLAVAARIPELQQGRVDLLAASLTHTAERESQVDFSLTIFVTGQKVMVRADSGIHDLRELAGKRVLTVKGGTQEPNVRKAVPGVEVVTFETAQQAFLALQQGKGIGFVNDEASLLNSFAKLGPAKKDYVILTTPISTEPLALGIKKGEPRLKAAVDDALRALEKSGEADKVFMKWYGPSTRLQYDKRHFRIDSDKI